MRDPFDRLSRPSRRRARLVLAAVAAAQAGPFLAFERQMRRSGGPGIVAFELAGTEARATRMLEAWGAEGREAARKSLLLDFLFPATYGPLQALTCTAVATTFAAQNQPMLAAAGGPLAWGQLAAAAFDYVENSALLLVLSGATGRLPALARRAALMKFGLLVPGWIYILLGRTVRRLSPS